MKTLEELMECGNYDCYKYNHKEELILKIWYVFATTHCTVEDKLEIGKFICDCYRPRDLSKSDDETSDEERYYGKPKKKNFKTN